MPVSGASVQGPESGPGRDGGADCPGAGEHSRTHGRRSDAGPDCRLPRRLRITSPALFREAFEAGTKCVGKLMVMWLRPGEDACLRLGVVTSKRSFRRSVDRARARRMLREAYRLNRWQLTGDRDVVLVARPRILDASLCDVQRDLLKLVGAAGMLQGTQL